MNSRSKSENAQRGASSFSNHEFDFGLGPAFTRSSASSSLNAQRQQNTAAQSGAGGALGASWPAQKSTASSSPSPSPSWTWSSSSKPTQPSSSSSSSAGASTWQGSSAGGGLYAPARSMVGDITGKNWGAMENIPKSSVDKSGLVGGLSRGASSDLFGDLWGASRSPVPSINSKQQQGSQGHRASAFSNLDSLVASLPKRTPMKDMKVSKPCQTEEMDDFVSVDGAQKKNDEDAGWAAFETINSSRSSPGPSESVKMPQQHSQKPSGEDPFGDFQSIPSVLAGTNNFSYGAKSSSTLSDNFFNLRPSAPSKMPASKSSNTSSNNDNVDPFAFLGSSKMPESQPINTMRVESDPFESFLGKVSSERKETDPVLAALLGSTKPQSGFTAQDVSDNWVLETDFGAGEDSTTELDDLPPPPPGISVTLLKEKGLEYYKQGQFADAIKWLSWAETLLHHNGESAQIIEVLTCRSSCLKEVGEYKKAVADCTKVTEHDNGNTSILLQRALLYESMEKYKLGMADLKEVLKKEPQNRVAMTTLARLKKMAD